jgi:hypothetical protein
VFIPPSLTSARPAVANFSTENFALADVSGCVTGCEDGETFNAENRISKRTSQFCAHCAFLWQKSAGVFYKL